MKILSFFPPKTQLVLAQKADILTLLPYSKATSRLLDWAIALREGGQL
jgi:hypothetical protein